MSQDPKRKNSVTSHMKDFISSILPSKAKKPNSSSGKPDETEPTQATTTVDNMVTTTTKELPDYSIIGELITTALPNDLLIQVFLFLSPPELLKCMQVNKRWLECADTNRIWKNLTETMFEKELIDQCVREANDKNWKQVFKEFGIRMDEKNHGTYVRVLKGGRVIESTSQEQYGVAISKMGFSTGSHTLRVKYEIVNEKDPKYCYCAIGVLPNSIAFDRLNNGEHSMTQGGGCSFTTYIGEIIYNSSTTLAKSQTLLTGSIMIAKMEIDAEKKSCKIHFSANGAAIGTAELEWAPPFYFAVCVWNGGKFTLF